MRKGVRGWFFSRGYCLTECAMQLRLALASTFYTLPHVLENRHKALGLASEDRYQACIWPFLLFKESNPVKKQKEKPREVHESKEPGVGAGFKLGAKRRKQWQHVRNAFKGLWKSQAQSCTPLLLVLGGWSLEDCRVQSQPRQYKWDPVRLNKQTSYKVLWSINL